MTVRTTRILLAASILLAAFSAKAGPILTGDWEGEWAGSGITADFDMSILQAADGSFTGSIDWTCTSGISCYGVELIAGSIDAMTSAFTFSTTALVNPYLNLGFASYSGVLSPGGTMMSGTDSSNGQWTATRVPEPGTLGLLGLGIAGIGMLRRRRNA